MPGALDALRRATLGLVRGTIHSFSDSPKLQTIDFRGLNDELITGVENFAHPYGFSSVPVPPSQQTKAAEVIVGCLFGNRSHPVVLGHIDRRYRPTGGENGQVQHYHFRGATAVFRQSGFAHNAGPDKMPHAVIVGATSVNAADGAHTTKVGGTTVLKEDGKVTTDTATKIFTGVVHLGAGGSLST